MKMYLTRTMYCERCAKAHYPKLHQKFFVWSKSQASFIVHEADMRSMNVGFTPHAVVYDSLQNENQSIVEAKAYCCMMDVSDNPDEGCGVMVTSPKKDIRQVNFNLQEAKDLKLRKEDWKALKLTSDMGYSLD